MTGSNLAGGGGYGSNLKKRIDRMKGPSSGGPGSSRRPNSGAIVVIILGILALIVAIAKMAQ